MRHEPTRLPEPDPWWRRPASLPWTGFLTLVLLPVGLVAAAIGGARWGLELPAAPPREAEPTPREAAVEPPAPHRTAPADPLASFVPVIARGPETTTPEQRSGPAAQPPVAPPSALRGGPGRAGPRPLPAPPELVPSEGTILFPLATEPRFSNTWRAPRPGNRLHEGTDIPSPKGTPVLAAAAGTVRWLQGQRGGRCCSLAIEHDDGWRTRYLHLDNDTPGTDDGQGYGIAEGLRRGTRVQAGDVIGWVGDSGNAETTGPHLHFELRRPDGEPVNPYPVLREALQRRLRALASEPSPRDQDPL